MSNDLIQIRVPHDLKVQAEAVFAAIGLKTGEAIRVFLQQCINQNGLPFLLVGKQPNEETLKAMEESDSGKTEKISLGDLRRTMGLPLNDT